MHIHEGIHNIYAHVIYGRDKYTHTQTHCRRSHRHTPIQAYILYITYAHRDMYIYIYIYIYTYIYIHTHTAHRRPDGRTYTRAHFIPDYMPDA